MATKIYDKNGLSITLFSAFGGMSRLQFTISDENGYMNMSLEECQELIKVLVDTAL